MCKFRRILTRARQTSQQLLEALSPKSPLGLGASTSCRHAFWYLLFFFVCARGRGFRVGLMDFCAHTLAIWIMDGWARAPRANNWMHLFCFCVNTRMTKSFSPKERWERVYFNSAQRLREKEAIRYKMSSSDWRSMKGVKGFAHFCRRCVKNCGYRQKFNSVDADTILFLKGSPPRRFDLWLKSLYLYNKLK